MATKDVFCRDKNDKNDTCQLPPMIDCDLWILIEFRFMQVTVTSTNLGVPEGAGGAVGG